MKSVSGVSIEKLPPQNIEAEIGVLGSILIDREVVPTVLAQLRSESFYLDTHQKIFNALITLYDHNRPLDLITLTEAIEKADGLDAVGGASTLVALPQAVPTSAHVEEYVRIVHEKAVLRNLIHTCTEIITHSYSTEEEVDQLLDMAEQRIFDLVQNRAKIDQNASFKDLVRQTMESIDRAYQKKGALLGISSGFKDFDEIMSGLQRSDMIVVAARPSMGKTAFALNIAEHVVVNEKLPVGIFSLEMSREQLVQRMLCAHAKVNLQHVRRGFISHENWRQLVHSANALSEAPLYIDDTPGLSATELRAKARRFKSAYNIELLIVDYLQLMQSFQSNRSENRQQEISEISRSLKSLARELNIPIIVLSQLNRAAENRPENKPRLSDLRESGAIEQDADAVILLLRREYYNPEDSPGEADIIIAKQRNGPTGDMKLTFVSEFTRFENHSPREEGE
ncbi:MAG: replicative DNA helicase [Chlamydiae bacterium]|nr:replicative DNA helicase [Chlamydiota bacterium]MBI3277550.1 replicative DNA helicase [Chlamydiota bacterium]